jgi:hypothetical protein
MTVVEESPRVRTVIPTNYGDSVAVYLEVEARLLGRPTRVKGKPHSVEVLLSSGRYTLADYNRTEALNETARALLEYVEPERRVVG